MLKISLNVFDREWIEELIKRWNAYTNVLSGNIVGSVEGWNVADGLNG